MNMPKLSTDPPFTANQLRGAVPVNLTVGGVDIVAIAHQKDDLTFEPGVMLYNKFGVPGYAQNLLTSAPIMFGVIDNAAHMIEPLIDYIDSAVAQKVIPQIVGDSIKQSLNFMANEFSNATDVALNGVQPSIDRYLRGDKG